ncbi:MAG: hypothetical protein KBS84_00990, partial [Treponema sp.]|nr:hypothetical protein [Candidatus Treponema scatequi]
FIAFKIFAEMLPLEFAMYEYKPQHEFYIRMPQTKNGKLKDDGIPVTDCKAGDIFFYSTNNAFCNICDDYKSDYEYQRLGWIKNPEKLREELYKSNGKSCQ